MPGSLKFGYPRPDDSAFEFQAYVSRSFLNGDFQHETICGTPRANVKAITHS